MTDGDRVHGTLLTAPKIRAVLAATPASGRAIRVRAFTPQGREILNLRAVEVETAVIEIPRPPGSDPALERHPGSLWFYGANGETVGFLPDHVLPLLQRPHALERAPDGPTTPRTVAGLQASLGAVLGGLENLATYLETRARRAGEIRIVHDAPAGIRILVAFATSPVPEDPAGRAMAVRVAAEALEALLAAAERSPVASDDSRAAASRFEPVAELARLIRDRELERYHATLAPA